MEPRSNDASDEEEDDSYEKRLFSHHVYEFQELDTEIRQAYLVGRLSLGELVAVWKRDYGE